MILSLIVLVSSIKNVIKWVLNISDHTKIPLTGQKTKKATANWINKNDNKCLQINAAPVTTNNQEIKIDPQRISKIKAFISK